MALWGSRPTFFVGVPRIYEKLQQGFLFRLGESGRLRNWLRRIARNAIINAMSRRPNDRGAGGTTVQELPCRWCSRMRRMPREGRKSSTTTRTEMQARQASQAGR